jgi:chemotaxis response regulator CheB
MSRAALTASRVRQYTGVVGGDLKTRRKARVLFVSELSLFGEGIEGLLRQEPGLEIVGWETDRGQAASRVRETAPDVVILTDAEAVAGLDVELLCMVKQGFRMRIVEIDLATNSVFVYRAEQRSIREVGDLLHTVEDICDEVNREGEVPLSPATGQPVA